MKILLIALAIVLTLICTVPGDTSHVESEVQAPKSTVPWCEPEWDIPAPSTNGWPGGHPDYSSFLAIRA